MSISFFYFQFERYFKHTELMPGAYEKNLLKSKTPPTHQFSDFFTSVYGIASQFNHAQH